MADQTVNVTITADASAVQPAIAVSDQLAASLDAIVKGQLAMVTATDQSTAAINALVASHTAGAAAATEHAEAETFFGAAISKTEVATNAASRALGALGFATGEASERIFAFTEALDAVGEATAPLLVIGAAFLAIGAGINFLKDGVVEAEKMQIAMAALGQAVTNQGGHWNEAKDGVEEFLASIRHATTYSGGEALEALNSLVAAGVSLADAEKIVAISTDVAAGSHRSLIDVVNSVKEAELGRGRSLAETDLVLKALIKSHGDLSAALADLSEKYRGDAAAALDTAQGKSEALRNELDHLAEELGVKLLPIIEEFSEVLIGVAEGAEQSEPAIIKWFDDIMAKAEEAYHVFWDLQNALPWNVTNAADWQKAGTAWGDLGNRAAMGAGLASTSPTGNWEMQHYTADQIALMRANDSLPQGAQPGGVYWTQKQAPAYNGSNEDQDWLQHVIDQARERAKGVREEAEKALEATRKQALQHDVQLGGDKTGGEGPTAIAPIDDDSVAKVSAYEAVQKQLDAALKNITDSEKSYSEAVKLATDSTDKDNAEMALHAKVAADAQQSVGLLTGQIAYEQNELARLTTAHDQATAKMNASREAQHALAAAMGEGTKRSLADKDTLDTLKREHDEAKKAVDATASAISGLTSSLESNSRALDAAKDKTHELAEAKAAIILAYNTGTESDQQRITDEEATYGKSLEAQAAYWKQSIQDDKDAYADGTYSMKQYYDNLLSDQKAYRDAMLKIQEDDVSEKKKQDQLNQSLADEEATYGKSLQQTLAYYQARYALLITGDSQERAEAMKYAEDIEKTESDAYQKRIEAHTEFVNNIKSAEESLVNDILQTQGSLGDKLKSVWKTVGEDLQKAIVTSFLNSTPIAGFNNELASILGTSPLGNANTAAPTAIVNPLNAIQQNTQQIATAMLQGGAPGGGFSAGVGDPAAFGLLGPFTGIGAADIISKLPTDQGLTGVFGGTSLANNVQQGVSYNPTTGLPTINFAAGAGRSTAATEVGAVVQGAGIGGSIAGLTGGNTSYGSIGGAAGDALGTWIGTLGGATGGPLGGAIGSLLGGLLGSFIGPNWGPASNYPDRSQPGYGQWLTDYQGAPATVNGQNVNPDPQYWEALGGQSIEANIGQWVASNANNSTLSQPLEQLLQQFEQLGGSDPGRDLGIESEKNGIFTLWSGAQIPVTQLQQLVTEYQDLLGGSGATSVYSLSRTYPNYTSTLSNGPVGSMENGVYTPATATAQAAAATAQPAQINISIAGKNVASVLLKDISKGLQDIQYGIVPGSYTATLAERAAGN